MPTTRPTISVVIPAFNVEGTINETIDSIIHQTFSDIEIIIVDDGSTDQTPKIIASYLDQRIRSVRQVNRGLAGARNTGIDLARGKYIAFCDSDDIWEAEKLDLHFDHLEANPTVGVSFCGSSLIDENGKFLKVSQQPKLKNITAADIFKRNPFGNGSVAVFRREALDVIAYRPKHETQRDWWFDESLRQSEDIDAWMRFALGSDWKIEGIPGLLTRYRIQAQGLSANLEKQFASWARVRDKVADIAPRFYAKNADASEAYQLRYLARRAFVMGDGKTAAKLTRRSLRKSLVPLNEEPLKTLQTWIASELQNLFGFSPAKHMTFNRKSV